MCEASIIGAQMFSTRDGQALDTFRLRRAFTSDEDEKVRATRIIETVKQLLQGKRQVLIDLGKESRHNRRLKPFTLPAAVEVSNTPQREVHRHRGLGPRPHRPAAQLTRAISDLNLTIGSAHIGTYGEKAVDVFYVTDLTGHKIEGKLRQRKIRDTLLAVFEPSDAPHAPVAQKSPMADAVSGAPPDPLRSSGSRLVRDDVRMANHTVRRLADVRDQPLIRRCAPPSPAGGEGTRTAA